MEELFSAYEEVRKWLLGARVKSCAAAADETWICQIVRENGYQGWMIWNPASTMAFRIPAAWHVRSLRDLRGAVRRPAADGSAEIGPTPVLFENIGT